MVGEPFNKRSVPCAFGIKIGLYFQVEGMLRNQHSFFFSVSMTFDLIFNRQRYRTAQSMKKNLFAPVLKPYLIVFRR